MNYNIESTKEKIFKKLENTIKKYYKDERYFVLTDISKGYNYPEDKIDKTNKYITFFIRENEKEWEHKLAKKIFDLVKIRSGKQINQIEKIYVDECYCRFFTNGGTDFVFMPYSEGIIII